MALTVPVFIFLSAVTFAVVMFFTRPSATDRAIERRLAGVQLAGKEDSFAGEGTVEFLKHANLSNIKWLNELLERWSTAHKISLLLAQAESSWSVSTVLFASSTLAGRGGTS